MVFDLAIGFWPYRGKLFARARKIERIASNRAKPNRTESNRIESNRVARGNGRVKWNSCEEFYSLSFCSLRVREKAALRRSIYAPSSTRTSLDISLSLAIAWNTRRAHTPGGKFSTEQRPTSRFAVKGNYPNLFHFPSIEQHFATFRKLLRTRWLANFSISIFFFFSFTRSELISFRLFLFFSFFPQLFDLSRRFQPSRIIDESFIEAL